MSQKTPLKKKIITLIEVLHCLKYANIENVRIVYLLTSLKLSPIDSAEPLMISMS